MHLLHRLQSIHSLQQSNCHLKPCRTQLTCLPAKKYTPDCAGDAGRHGQIRWPVPAAHHLIHNTFTPHAWLSPQTPAQMHMQHMLPPTCHLHPPPQLLLAPQQLHQQPLSPPPSLPTSRTIARPHPCTANLCSAPTSPHAPTTTKKTLSPDAHASPAAAPALTHPPRLCCAPPQTPQQHAQHVCPA